MWSLRMVAPGGSLRDRGRPLRAIKDEGEVTRSLMQARCDRGAEIALMIGLTVETAKAIRCLDEHWDGRGQPRGLRGEEIPLLGRILCLAQTVEIFHAAGGVDAASTWPGSAAAAGSTRRWSTRSAPACATSRSGTRSPSPTSRPGSPRTGSCPPRRPPRPHRGRLRRRDRRQVAVDLPPLRPRGRGRREPRRHARRGAAAVRDLRRAALLHDIGKLAISNRILDKAGALTAAEPAVVRQHPRTAQILERVPGFERLAALASAHHERLDGGGYPRGLTADELDLPMRVLAVADVYEA